MDIKHLIKQAKTKNKDALIELIMAKKDEYYKLAFVYVRNKEDALDTLQDMILLIFEKIHTLKKEEAFYSWSKTILVNCCRNHLRKNKKIITMNEIPEMMSQDNNEKIEDTLFVESHLSKLSVKYQEIIRLRFYLDLDYTNISQLLNIPIGTVKSRLNTALTKLKRSMGGEYWNE
ncbi:MAG: RNA polymerase sigma factor [Eubacteriales bacterium]